MQGRLSPPDGGRFQSFPRARWAEEFAVAAAVPLSYIEWIYDDYGADVNPLLSEEGRRQMARHMEASQIQIRAMCADWFMDFPLLRCADKDRAARRDFLDRLLRAAVPIGVRRIVLPFVDASRIASIEDEDVVVAVLESILPTAEEVGVELHLETDLGPEAFRALLDRVPHPWLKVNYDSGNSSSHGYRASDEIAAYGGRIGSVHIKDRVRGGGTVPLGTGDADFVDVFESLKTVGYAGDFTMQVARGEPGGELDWARRNLDFIRRYWKS
jgi:hexulose-6-phosphate isomerase